ncbi:MAG: hypothetical protein KME19_24365 [Microcoleus vaginatus WJT46-NPBG5]|jgi:hypothetical protein|nr:hypothetical protein [Microcoleus vaginatus WJT46-NPBG5]
MSVTHYIRGYAVTGLVVAAMLSGCRPSRIEPTTHLETYRNPRYKFEFPYPKAWIAAEPPTNQDGQAFNDPKNPQVEIRGWAGYRVTSSGKRDKHKRSKKDESQALKQNFTTQQGVAGELEVNLGPQISSMTLTLVQGKLEYNCYAQSPSEKFADYYRLFYNIAGQYKIPPAPEKP